MFRNQNAVIDDYVTSRLRLNIFYNSARLSAVPGLLAVPHPNQARLMVLGGTHVVPPSVGCCGHVGYGTFAHGDMARRRLIAISSCVSS